MTDPCEHPRLDWHLDNWSRWMRVSDSEKLDCQVLQIWSSGSSDFDSMVDAADIRCAVTVDAIISGMPDVERTLMYLKHLGPAVWRFNRESQYEVYDRARGLLSAGLLRKGIW